MNKCSPIEPCCHGGVSDPRALKMTARENLRRIFGKPTSIQKTGKLNPKYLNALLNEDD